MLSELVLILESLIIDYGEIGVFAAMLLETVFPPIPSELVMPFAGFLASSAGLGYFRLFTMIISGTLGATLGAVIIYFVARHAGRPLILKTGKRFMIDEKKLMMVERWFEKHGDHTVFLCRMAPGLREIVSIPAGIAKMNFTKFFILTLAGTFIWTAFLGIVGYLLGDAWEELNPKTFFNLVTVLLVLAFVVYIVRSHFKNMKSKSKSVKSSKKVSKKSKASKSRKTSRRSKKRSSR